MLPVSSYLTHNQFVRENLATYYRRYFIVDLVITFTVARFRFSLPNQHYCLSSLQFYSVFFRDREKEIPPKPLMMAM